MTVWKDVRKEVPDAELHLFYGWDCYDKMMAQGHRPKDFKDYMVNLMAQEGVFEHGRVNHKQLIKEFYKSGIYAYPTHFQEISCISAMKAQACGCVPIVFDYAALNETVKSGVKIKGIGTDEANMETFKNELIKLLKDSAYQEKLREEVSKHKEEFSWKHVAKQWSEKLFPQKRNSYKNLDEYKKEYTTHGEFKLVNFTPEGEIIYYQRYRMVVDAIKEYGIKSLLDVGCSDGALVFCVDLETDAHADGVDADEKAVHWANERARNNGLKTKFYHSVFEEFEPPRKYGAVSALEILEHVIDPKEFLKKVESHVEDGGYVFLSTPDKNGYYGEKNFNAQHINHYDKEELEKLIGKDRIVKWDNCDKLLRVVYKK